ncbi:MAG: hypothetical protein R3B95_11890 [Nitrospirales bacterium]|nr:hypothetical protein [Nitrospirales bacterium]
MKKCLRRHVHHFRPSRWSRHSYLRPRTRCGRYFYVAVALIINGTFRGTNAVWLGDRITPFDLQIRNGILVARYAEGGHGEPMVTTPTIQRAKFLILKDAQLESIAPLEEGEQVVEGWVTTGHEVRSFRPCLQGVLNNKDFQGQICPG